MNTDTEATAILPASLSARGGWEIEAIIIKCVIIAINITGITIIIIYNNNYYSCMYGSRK